LKKPLFLQIAASIAFLFFIYDVPIVIFFGAAVLLLIQVLKCETQTRKEKVAETNLM
jgi:hypothetical protein